MPSQPASASVLAEVACQPLGRRAPSQLFDVLAFEDRLAIEGILKTFELGLEMLQPRLERLGSTFPTGRACSRGIPPPAPQPTQSCVHNQDLPPSGR